MSSSNVEQKCVSALYLRSLFSRHDSWVMSIDYRRTYILLFAIIKTILYSDIRFSGRGSSKAVPAHYGPPSRRDWTRKGQTDIFSAASRIICIEDGVEYIRNYANAFVMVIRERMSPSIPRHTHYILSFHSFVVEFYSHLAFVRATERHRDEQIERERGGRVKDRRIVCEGDFRHIMSTHQ